MSARKRSPQRQGIEGRIDSKGRPQYRPYVYNRKANKKVRGSWTYSLAEARGWRVDALAKLERGLLTGHRDLTVREAADEFIEGIRTGAIRNRSGRAYKPSAMRGYESDLRRRVVPVLGSKRLADVTLADVQRWADTVAYEGIAPSTVRNAMNSVRALYGWAVPRGLAPANPTVGVRLPTGGTKRDRIAPPDEAEHLLAALPQPERAIWATALYAGLRRGELLALRVCDVDLASGVLRVHAERGSYDAASRTFHAPKSRAAVRAVPIIARLRPILTAAVAGKAQDALMFGRDADVPFSASATLRRATTAWKRAGLAPIGLHESRHTFASYLIASDLNAKAVTVLMGHSSITTTFDRYGHLFPGHQDEARDRLDALLQVG